jgi:hypothetical protein
VANMGCVLFKEGDYAGALAKFQEAVGSLGQLVSLGPRVWRVWGGGVTALAGLPPWRSHWPVSP